MFEFYAKLSKATDFFNSQRVEEEHIEYYEVLKMIKNKHDENEVMKVIIDLYSNSH